MQAEAVAFAAEVKRRKADGTFDGSRTPASTPKLSNPTELFTLHPFGCGDSPMPTGGNYG
ncbi:hypothetical protein SAMN04488548_13836 [Gordonia westfalica]|uniref:Uncharacterized protein n=1 Tax=Gordonia westfalica TaxID=158898 RepID=A0A1H2M3E3_9ACTN|nr:hypothetical protein SAMN04488548_13836 [Gordonia westfalica]